MLQLLTNQAPITSAEFDPAARDYGVWNDHVIPEDRSGWEPHVRDFYAYWLSIGPPGRLPGRQHLKPEKIVPMLSRLWILDVSRDPLRFRFRLCGTEIVRSFGREATGAWLDEFHPQSIGNPSSRDRLRFIAETGRPTWRHGPAMWDRDPRHRTVENCIVPLAGDGLTVDKIVAFSVVFDAAGKLL